MHKIAVVLGIRPDFIRTSEVLRLLDEHDEVELSIIHTGQHYDENLNDVFFKEMNIPKVTHQLDTRGKNHNEQHSKLIIQLSDVLEEIRPDVCVFLGDANAVVGCIAPLKLGIPIAHIEAGMRSYNWKMPEERNRVIIDRVSDVLYVYQHDYKVQLVQEGIPAHKIEVVGNVIVDVLDRFKDKTQWKGDDGTPYGTKRVGLGGVIERDNYALMTLHRNEHMSDPKLAQKIITEVGLCTQDRNLPVVLIEMPRLKALGLNYPSNFIPINPRGFFDFLQLEANAAIEFTDSGTNQEVASILGVPCVVTRDCTERPECWESHTTVMATPGYISGAVSYVMGRKPNPEFTLGDGESSKKIVIDLLMRLKVPEVFNVPQHIDVFRGKHSQTFNYAIVRAFAIEEDVRSTL